MKKLLISALVLIFFTQSANADYAEDGFLDKIKSGVYYSYDFLKENIPFIDSYTSDENESEKKDAYDVLTDGEGDMLDKIGIVFEKMEKYINIQKTFLILTNPDLKDEFKTLGHGDVRKSIDAIKDYKKMQREVYLDAGIDIDEDEGLSDEEFEDLNLYEKDSTNLTKIKNYDNFKDIVFDKKDMIFNKAESILEKIKSYLE